MSHPFTVTTPPEFEGGDALSVLSGLANELHGLMKGRKEVVLAVEATTGYPST